MATIRAMNQAGLAAVLLFAALPSVGAGQGTAPAAGFVPGPRTLFDLNLAAESLGAFPASLRSLRGTMTVVDKDGVRMLRASNVSEFLVTLPEFLPDSFTVELDLVPKKCCNPEDLALEGTRRINQGVASARIQWDSDGQLIIVGGGEMYQSPMPEALSATLPGALTQVAVSFEGGTVKLYTNGRRLYTQSDRAFVRGRVLRVFLGGQDDKDYAVHLARLRVGTTAPPWPGFPVGGFVAGSRTLFELDMTNDSLGHFPKQLKALRGPMAVVLKDGVKMLRATNTAEFLVPLPEALPGDFTLQFELIPKECCNPQDLSFEGTASIDQGVGSAHIHWDSDGYLAVIGGGEMYQSPVPDGPALIAPLAPTQVNASFDGGTVKLYTNGRRLYTLTDRRFVRGRVLRVFLGGQDGPDYAVHLARLRIATNSPPP